MNASQLRRSMWAGIVFVALFIAGVIVTFGNSPNIKSSDTAATAAQKWLTHLSSSSHRTGLIIGAYLLIIAAIAFLWFSLGLRAWLTGDSPVGRFISGLGVLGAGAIAFGGMFGGAWIAGAIAFGNEPLPLSGEGVRLISDLFFPFLFVIFGLISAVLIVTAAVTVLREGRAPGWIAHTGWIGALGALVGVTFFPFVLALLWYLAVAIAGLAGASSAPPARSEAP